MLSPVCPVDARPVEVVDLTKRFGSVVALDGVSLAIEPGDVHGLLGPNGAGKSTLMRTIFGLVRPDSGRVELFGREQLPDSAVTALEGVAGFVDRPHFYPFLTARRTLRLLADADGLADPPGVDEVLARVGLSEAAGRRVSGWSTGMLQRLGIAAALMRRPRLLILDEPTEGLDPSGARDLLGLVRSLADDGVTVLFSSHDMSEVDAICDTVTILNHGRIARSAPLAELRSTAPIGRHRLMTSDNQGALRLAEGHPLTISAHPVEGLTLEAGRTEMHDYICDLGRAGISVVRLVQEVAPLTALFYLLTEGSEGDPTPAAEREPEVVDA